jgi:DNA-binding CsgD family transcriptional regulator
MLVGREAELLVLRTMLSAARVGDSRVVVLRGEPGIGKSALLDRAAELAEGMRVVRATGFESEQYVPFSGLSQVLGPLLPLLDQIPAPRAAALSSALLLDHATQTEPQRFAVGAGTLSLLSRAAEDRPLAVLLDDAHLLDSSSVDALAFAVRRLVSDTIAVVACVRPDETGAEPWLQLPGLDVVGLGLDDAAALLGTGNSPLGSRRIARLHRATGGNPLALLELDQDGQVDDVPDTSVLPVSQRLSDAFLGRVHALDPATRATLLVAAADSASASTVHAACRELRLEESGLTDAEDAGLVTLRGDEILFRHPLVRSAIYGSADPAQRRSVHRALAAVLPAHETDRLAWHLSRGAVAPDEDTADALDAVATRAAARGAHGIGALALERAAGLSVDGADAARRLARAGELAWLAGRTDHARSLLERVLAGQPDYRPAPRVREVLGALEARAGSLDAASRILLEAADEAETADDVNRAVRVLGDAVLVAFYKAAPAEARQAADRIAALLDRVSATSTRLMAQVATGMAMVISGAGEEGTVRLRDAAYELATADDAEGGDPIRLPLRIQGALWLRDTGPQRQIVAEVLTGLREHATIASLPYLLMHIGREAATSDRWDDAEAAYGEAIQLSRENGHTTELSVALAGLSIVLARQGRATETEAAAAEAQQLCRHNQVTLAEMWLTFARGDLAAGADDLETAVGHYRDLETLLKRTGFDDPDQSSAAELVETLVHLRRTREARTVAHRLLVLAQGKGQPWSLARAERGRALTSDYPQAHFAEALRLHGLTPDRYEEARSQLAYGAWLRRERQRTEARPLLRSALETFENLGARPWADKAAAELLATGETARRRALSPEQTLTPQERQIAQLLAEGRTTRESAAALFISPKTVEYHLRHVYMKLGINSRAALAEQFAATAPDERAIRSSPVFRRAPSSTAGRLDMPGP